MRGDVVGCCRRRQPYHQRIVVRLVGASSLVVLCWSLIWYDVGIGSINTISASVRSASVSSDIGSVNDSVSSDSDDNHKINEESSRRRQTYQHAFPNATELNKIQNFDEILRLVDTDVPVPRNLHILFMGDSLTRYQYLDLVYFLSHNGTWNGATPSPPISSSGESQSGGASERSENVGNYTNNLVIGRAHDSWNDFFVNTNAALAPFERCDCFRTQEEVSPSNTIENRYFYDAARNNSVVYLQKFGDWPWRTSWKAEEAFRGSNEDDSDNGDDDDDDNNQSRRRRNDNSGPTIQNISQLKPIYTSNWIGAIQNFVCHLHPKPDVFIFNEGLWDKNNDLVDDDLQYDIVRALSDCGVRSMFKTTTKKRREEGEQQRLQHYYYGDLAEYEIQLCQLVDLCLDVSWTGLVPRDMYWDARHFLPLPYTLLNLHLLSVLYSVEGIGVT